MNFKINKLYLNEIPELTSSYDNVVSRVDYTLSVSNGSVSASANFYQYMDIYKDYNKVTSSFSSYNDLTENQVKNWVTHSFDVTNSRFVTHGVNHPTSSWSEFVTSVSSSLVEELNESLVVESNNLPW